MSSPRTLKILYALHPEFEILDFTGPLEVLFWATHTAPNTPSKVFEHKFTAVEPVIKSNQHLKVQHDTSISEAHATLEDYDVLVIPGGGSPGVLDNKTEPIHLIKAFVSLPKRQDGGIRYLLSVCTGSLFLAEAGVLDGKTATTHPYYYDKLREITTVKGSTNVLEERFVVNKVDEEKGLQIITGGGVSCGIDASLWLIGQVAGRESMEKVQEAAQYAYQSGVEI